jgi:hypothetical protein
MPDNQQQVQDPRSQHALAALQARIVHHDPSAPFEVAAGDDPGGIYLTPIIDIEDTDAVLAVVLDRLIELQVDEGLPIFVVPLQPLQRVLAQLEEQRHKDAGASIPSL